MFGPIRAVIFDLDGTLVDTMPSVIEGLGKAVEKVTGQLPETSELLKTFGPAPQDVLRQWMPEERVPDGLRNWLDFEKSLTASDLKVFPGVEAMLKGLVENGTKISLFTGRDRAGTLRILKAHGWLDTLFTEALMVCGDDGLNTKPNPDGILHLLPKIGYRGDQVLMVGDHPHDMKAARSAGVRAGAALWDLPKNGKTHRSQFRQIWESWNSEDIDIRLVQPGSLLEWARYGN